MKETTQVTVYLPFWLERAIQKLVNEGSVYSKSAFLRATALSGIEALLNEEEIKMFKSFYGNAIMRNDNVIQAAHLFEKKA